LSCTYEYAKHVSKSVFGNLLPYRNWIPKEFPDIDIMSHFVMMENREGIASSGGFSAMGVEDCLAGCIGTPACPGAIYVGNSFFGQCNFLEKRHFEMGHLTRGGSSQAGCSCGGKKKGKSHVFMRRGFLHNYNRPELLEKVLLATENMNEDGTNATWTTELSEAVVFANEQISKRLTAIPLDDDIYEWINNVTGQTSGTFTPTSQNVPLRTSLYSLAFPVHPFVLRHVRVLRNYLSSEHDVDNLAELILAIAFRYRNFPSILNATSDILNDQVQDDDELYLQCKLASALRGEGGIIGSAKFPTAHDPKPSPLAALDNLLKSAAQAPLDFSLSTAPWPLLATLQTAHFSARECDYVRRHPNGITTWYNKARDRKETRCRESNWRPDSLPRISQDGGQCVQQAHLWVGYKSCLGAPADTVTQPKHRAAYGFNERGGKWKPTRFNWIQKGYETTSQFTLQTDDVAGVISSAVVPFESIESITNGINLGLSSYIDVRLALHLFRNVYTHAGRKY
jgi:hypothetical protein